MAKIFHVWDLHFITVQFGMVEDVSISENPGTFAKIPCLVQVVYRNVKYSI